MLNTAQVLTPQTREKQIIQSQRARDMWKPTLLLTFSDELFLL